MTRPTQESESDPSVLRATVAFFRLLAVAEPISFELWKTHGLTLGQVRLLQRIRSQPVVAGDLAKELGVRSASLTRMMERLEAGGLVERTLDREDRRRILVSITARGVETLGGLDFWRKGAVAQALQAMSEAERDHLSQTLEDLTERLRAQEP